jgi:hypothetical protein
MAAAAHAAGLGRVHAQEQPVDVGVTEAGQLVRYRLGHPAFAAWLDALGPARTAGFATAAERAVGGGMAPYRPRVVFLRAVTVPTERRRRPGPAARGFRPDAAAHPRPAES